jgi:hypothetical protein
MSTQSQTSRYALALAVLAVVALHTAHKLNQGLLSEMLWACHVASLLTGIGLLLDSLRLVAIGTVFHLAVGLPAYMLDVLVSGTTLTSALVHSVPPLAGLAFLRRTPLPRWTMASAAGLYLALIPVSRWLTDPALNVNLAFAPYAPLRSLLGAPWISWLLNALLIVAALFAAQVVLRKCQALHENAEINQ